MEGQRFYCYNVRNKNKVQIMKKDVSCLNPKCNFETFGNLFCSRMCAESFTQDILKRRRDAEKKKSGEIENEKEKRSK